MLNLGIKFGELQSHIRAPSTCSDDVARVIASCDPATPRGLRDRAILLLRARLALRGGDVANLHLDDIDWDNGLIRVAGKTKHAVALPLPQDAGEALLDYIERARPVVASTKVFIRAIAPFVPFASSSPIAIIVRDALKRAGVENANLRGAHLLRHSAATNMLRSGATLDAVGAVLRHRSPETTAIYAKVDTAKLGRVDPMVAPGYSVARSNLAKKMGLGRKAGEAPKKGRAKAKAA